jgi:hypothetical protein
MRARKKERQDLRKEKGDVNKERERQRNNEKSVFHILF